MFIGDVKRAFEQRMETLAKEQERICGRGITDTNVYWSRVGEIRGLRRSIDELRKIVKKETEEELND